MNLGPVLGEMTDKIKMAEMENGSHIEVGCHRVHKNISQVPLQVLAMWSWNGVLPLCPREERILHVLAGLSLHPSICFILLYFNASFH